MCIRDRVGTDTAVQDAAIAGQIVYVARMAHAQTSDTLSDTDAPMVVEPWPLPRPLLPLALHATSRNDDDKLSNALQRLLVEDPTVSVERDPATDQLVLWTMGQAHLDLLLARLTGRYGVNVEREEIKIPLRETFIAETVGHGRHVKPVSYTHLDVYKRQAHEQALAKALAARGVDEPDVTASPSQGTTPDSPWIELPRAKWSQLAHDSHIAPVSYTHLSRWALRSSRS